MIVAWSANEFKKLLDRSAREPEDLRRCVVVVVAVFAVLVVDLVFRLDIRSSFKVGCLVDGLLRF